MGQRQRVKGLEQIAPDRKASVGYPTTAGAAHNCHSEREKDAVNTGHKNYYQGKYDAGAVGTSCIM